MLVAGESDSYAYRREVGPRRTAAAEVFADAVVVDIEVPGDDRFVRVFEKNWKPPFVRRRKGASFDDFPESMPAKLSETFLQIEFRSVDDFRTIEVFEPAKRCVFGSGKAFRHEFFRGVET